MEKEKLISTLLQNRNKRINVEKGCKAAEFGGCFCTGECKKIIGYWENGIYTSLNNDNLKQNTNELSNNKG